MGGKRVAKTDSFCSNKQVKRLEKENHELKEALSILTNTELVQKLNQAMNDVKHGRYTLK